MSDLKAGDSLDFKIGDKTLTIEPVPYGQVKKAMRIMFQASKDITAGALMSIPELVDKYMNQVMPLMFKAGRFPFLTQDWLENEVTVPVLRKMLEAAIVVNGLEDFFGKKAGNGVGGTILPANTGSTTSSALPMDGDSKTLTS